MYYTMHLTDFEHGADSDCEESAILIDGNRLTGCGSPPITFPVMLTADRSLMYCRPRSTTGNITGSSQKACHEFPDTIPAEPDNPAADDEPGALMIAPALPRESYVVRQEDIYYQVRWLLMSEDSPIARQVQDVCAGMQAHDRDDMRQDLCITHWRRAVAAEYRGNRRYSVGKWLIGDVIRWIGRNVGKNETTANPDPLTAEELRTKSLESRSATIDKELRNEMASALAAMAKAKPPAPVVSFSW